MNTITARIAPLLFLLMALATGLLLWPPPRVQPSAAHDPRLVLRPELFAQYVERPLYFEENRGQTHPQAKFVSRGPGYTLFLTPTEAVLTLQKRPASSSANPRNRRDLLACGGRPCLGGRRGLDGHGSRRTVDAPEPDSVLRLRLVGANPSPEIIGMQPLPGRSNYFVGSEPQRWRTNIPHYSRVRYEQVYPGVDLIYYGNQRQLEFDLVVAPGARPETIRFEIEGAEKLEVDAKGNLLIRAGAQHVQLLRPTVYQESDSGRQEVSSRYQLLAQNRVAFEVGKYDATRPLVIDPVLEYSTYLGGSGYDEIHAIGLDSLGNIYVAGITASANFPTVGPLQANLAGFEDIFVAKLRADGSALLYSTYLGGADTDDATALAVDGAGAVTITGYTFSLNFPMLNPFQSTLRGVSDAIVARLNPAGSSLIFSTYLGGTGSEVGQAIDVDSSGNTYLTGQTNSSNFPVAGPFQAVLSGPLDAFVAKLSPTGAALTYSTYLGGSSADAGYAIAVDSGGSAFIAGATTSNNFPTSNPVQFAYGGGTCGVPPNTSPCADVFVTKLNGTGNSLVYSTYLGGNNEDQGWGIAVDVPGNAYVTGLTTSANFPTASPIQATFGGLADAFVTKLNAAGSGFVYSTYLGGLVSDRGTAIAVDGLGRAYITGDTASSTFPTVNPIQARNNVDAFVAELNPAGSGFLYSTYLGGSNTDLGLAIAVDGAGRAYVGGATISDDFPRVSPFQNSIGGGICGSAPPFFPCPDGFISRLIFNPSLFAGGMVSAASFAPGAPVSPGSIAALFGSDMTTAIASAAAIPLQTTLGGVSVRMNNILAPLFYVSGSQVNLQVPWELAGQAQANVVLTVGSTPLNPITVNLSAANPGIFPLPSQGSARGAIVISTTGEVAAPVGSIPGRAARPATRGVDFITIYCTGLGAVTNRPNTGDAARVSPLLSQTLATPTVTIGGVGVTPDFSGMVPGLVGLYQVNVLVPANAPTSSTVSVVVSVGGASSNTVQIAVQ